MMKTALLLMIALLAGIGAAQAATTLTPNQYVTVNVAGQDAFANAAPISAVTCAIDVHATAYCGVSGTVVTVVSRGPIGNFLLTLTALSGDGVTTITSTSSFSVVAGPAASLALTISAALPWNSGVLHLPVGW